MPAGKFVHRCDDIEAGRSRPPRSWPASATRPRGGFGASIRRVAAQRFPSQAWQQHANDVNDVSGLVDQVAHVIRNGVNGVDIDYEDDNGFKPGGYPGITFLIDLTNRLAQNLRQGQDIITHAPLPPYFDRQGGFENAYTEICQAAGDNISGFNCQVFNNSSYDESAVPGVGDGSPARAGSGFAEGRDRPWSNRSRR